MDFNNREGRWFYWVSAGRMALLVLLLGAAYVLPGQTTLSSENFVRLTWVLGAAFLVSAGSNLWYRKAGLSSWLVRFQTFADIVLVSLAILWSGGSQSPFIFLYPLAIITACLLKKGGGGTCGAILSTLSYGLICVWTRPSGVPLSGLAFNFFVNMAAFNATAVLSTALARRLSRAEEKLSQVRVDLHRMEQIHRHVANSLNAGLITGDEKGRITSFNQAAGQLLGVDLSDYYGKNLSEIWASGAEFLQGLAPEPGTKRAELFYAVPGGAPRLFGVSTFDLRDDAGLHLGYGMIFQDITEIKAREERRQRTKRLAALGEMAAGLAHEIRNPLASLSGSAQFLRESGWVLPEGERLIDIILREANRLNNLTESFLEYARPGEGRPEKIRLTDAVRSAVGLISQKNGGMEVTIFMDIPDDIEVYLDPDQLRQVLVHLIQNAFDAIDVREGQLQIRASKTADSVEFSIEDNGKGIDPENLSRIFDPFFTTRPEATGLGLAVVHQLIKSWGGDISVESLPGKGCKVTVSVPVNFL